MVKHDGDSRERPAPLSRGAEMKKMIAAVLLMALAATANAYIVWRLIGSNFNPDTRTMVCTYEGRMSDGRTTVTTVIVPGSFCPSQPGGAY
jgi:hypothetical protein